MQQALNRYLQSAWAGYANFGSDIGGYRLPQDVRDSHLLIRWAQLGLVLPSLTNCEPANADISDQFYWLIIYQSISSDYSSNGPLFLR